LGGPASSPAVANHATTCPAVANDETIYVGAGFFYALSPEGTLRWRYDTGTSIGGPPAIAADCTIYFPSGHWLYALRPNGTLKWIQYINHDGYEPGSAPAIGKDGTIYINTHDGVLHAVDPDGTLKWTYDTGALVQDVPSSPAVGPDGTVYFGGGGFLYAVDPYGRLVWKFPAGCNLTAPSIGGDGTIYFGNNSCGTLYALSPDGNFEWSYSMGSGYMRSAPAIGFKQRLYVQLYFPSRLLAFGPE
jgi:outer membrane protein assembly factor BamB